MGGFVGTFYSSRGCRSRLNQFVGRSYASIPPSASFSMDSIKIFNLGFLSTASFSYNESTVCHSRPFSVESRPFPSPVLMENREHAPLPSQAGLASFAFLRVARPSRRGPTFFGYLVRASHREGTLPAHLS